MSNFKVHIKALFTMEWLLPNLTDSNTLLMVIKGILRT